MNSTSSSSAFDSSDIFYLQASLRSIGLIGVIFNAFTLFILKNQRLKHNMYTFLWLRAFCNMIVCMFAIGWVDIKFLKSGSSLNHPDTYLNKLYMLFIFGIPVRMALFASAISDLFLILNR